MPLCPVCHEPPGSGKRPGPGQVLLSESLAAELLPRCAFPNVLSRKLLPGKGPWEPGLPMEETTECTLERL